MTNYLLVFFFIEVGFTLVKNSRPSRRATFLACTFVDRPMVRYSLDWPFYLYKPCSQ